MSVEWISSSPDSQLETRNIELQNPDGIPDSAIQIFQDRELQMIDGFVACFNEFDWGALRYLPENEQVEVLQSLFDTITGCNFNICRMPIGANDYAVDWISHNETMDCSIGFRI